MGAFIIAEAGVNHNGDLDLARGLIDAACAAGADAVKFQTFTAEEVTIESAPKAQYQKELTRPDESQLDMIRTFQLSRDAHFGLIGYCRDKGIRFMSSPFDIDSLHFLCRDLALDILKIPSGEVVNGPMLMAAGQSDCDIIMSTGMADLDEIRAALGVLAYAMTGGTAPSPAAFESAFASDAGRAAIEARVSLLHCTTAYPTPYDEVNLRAMQTIADAFGLPVGYSDHTPGTVVSTAAVALGASIIEKHFTLDRTLPGPDHKASLEPNELAALVREIRAVEAALGSAEKSPGPTERENMDIARKSLVTTKPVKAGEAFSTGNLGIKRPGNGISPMRYWEWIGKPAGRDYDAGVLVEEQAGSPS